MPIPPSRLVVLFYFVEETKADIRIKNRRIVLGFSSAPELCPQYSTPSPLVNRFSSVPFQFDTICINDDNSGKIDYDGLYIPNFILDNNAKDSHKNKGIQTAITSIKKSISSIQKHLKAQNDAVYLPNYFYQLILSAQLNALRWFRNHFTLNLGSVNEMAVAMQKKKGFHFPDFYNDGSIGHMFAFNTVYLYKDSDKVEFLREYNPCWTNLPHEDSFRRLVV